MHRGVDQVVNTLRIMEATFLTTGKSLQTQAEIHAAKDNESGRVILLGPLKKPGRNCQRQLHQNFRRSWRIYRKYQELKMLRSGKGPLKHGRAAAAVYFFALTQPCLLGNSSILEISIQCSPRGVPCSEETRGTLSPRNCVFIFWPV